jgi:hypothetical protein
VLSRSLDTKPRRPLNSGASIPFAKAYRFVKSCVYDIGLYPYGVYRHDILLGNSERLSTHTWTCFYRAPAQLRALSGPVLDYLDNPQRSGEHLDILLVACSSGARDWWNYDWGVEPYTPFHPDRERRYATTFLRS